MQLPRSPCALAARGAGVPGCWKLDSRIADSRAAFPDENTLWLPNARHSATRRSERLVPGQRGGASASRRDGTGRTPGSPLPLPPAGGPSGSFIATTLWQRCAGVLNQKDPLVCSATPHFSAHSSFMILMRVFFQETHISLFDLGASVRVFF